MLMQGTTELTGDPACHIFSVSRTRPFIFINDSENLRPHPPISRWASSLLFTAFTNLVNVFALWSGGILV